MVLKSQNQFGADFQEEIRWNIPAPKKNDAKNRSAVSVLRRSAEIFPALKLSLPFLKNKKF